MVTGAAVMPEAVAALNGLTDFFPLLFELRDDSDQLVCLSPGPHPRPHPDSNPDLALTPTLTQSWP